MSPEHDREEKVETYDELRNKNARAVFVFGAGMEMGKDIGLCSSGNLPASILTYMDSDKDTVDVLKKKVKTESFKTIVQKRLNKLLQNKKQLSELITGIKKKYPKSDFVMLLDYINSEIDRLLPEETDNEQKIENKNPTKIEECYNRLKEDYGTLPDVSPDFLIDVDKLAFSTNWTKIITGLIDTYIDVVTKKGAESDDSKCLSAILGWVVDYDSLLTESYIGFYTKKPTLKRRYIYLSWLLWAYLSSIDRKTDAEDTIYNKVIQNCLFDSDFVITLNYSTFLDRAMRQAGKDDCYVHFHGDLSHYINGRSEEKVAQYDDEVPSSNILEKALTNWDNIPSMMPPFDIKPLISNAYLERWFKAKSEIDTATQIFVVGYSFSHSDEHFSELLYNAKNKGEKEIYIVCPSFENQKEFEHRFAGYKKVKPITHTAEEFFVYVQGRN